MPKVFFNVTLTVVLASAVLKAMPARQSQKPSMNGSNTDVVWDDLLPAARRRIEEAGVGYVDEEGDLVTQIVDGRNCVFTTYGPGGMCLCAIEKAFREGRTDFRKPMSCYLYPLRLTEYPTFTAVNYHRWKICKCAEIAGRAKGVRLYQFMRQPLIDRFGQEWYDELCEACQAYLAEYGD